MRKAGTARVILTLGLAMASGLPGCARVGTGDRSADGARPPGAPSTPPGPEPRAAGERDRREAAGLAPSHESGAGNVEVCLSSRTEVAVALVNRHRHDRGLPALRVDSRLVAAAAAHARDLATHGRTGHIGSDGSEPSTRVERTGYRWRFVGENVAAGVATPSLVVAGWMDSPPHRRAILTGAFEDVGVAYVDAPGSSWNTWWVMVFGTPLGSASDAPRVPPCGPTD